MRFVSFLQRLGYLVFLQVLLLPCLAYSTFHVSLGHNFGFSFASFCYCCSYTYFILVGPFCFGLFVFHSAPGADFVWKEIFLFVSAVRDRSSPGAGFVSEKIVWGIRSKTVRLWDPGFCLKPSISVYVRDRLALGACSLFGTNFCWFGSRSRFSFLWNERYSVCGLRPFGSGSRFWSYTVRDRLALKKKQGVDVDTIALTSVRNALQKPETVYDLRRLLLTSRPWFEQPGHLPTKRRTITQPFWMN